MTERPRIAHLTTVDVSLARLLATELSDAVQAGFQVFGISAPGPFVDEIEALGVIHIPIPSLTRTWSPGADLRATSELWRVLGDLDLDVLHTHTPKAGVIGRIVGRLRHVPIVVNTCHGLPSTSEDPLAKRITVLVIEAFAAQFSDAELFQNSEDLRSITRLIHRRSTQLVGNGIDLRKFQFDGVARERVRTEIGVPPDRLVVGGVGRRVAEKGIHEFAHAAMELSAIATFIWVGPNDSEKRDAIGSDLEGVTFLGERSDMPAVYSAMDIFVLPSYREGFPRSAMEAAACGRPLVLTDIRGSREIGTAGDEVVFVPAHDPVSLTAAIRAVLISRDDRVRLGLAIQARAHAFDQHRVAQTSFAVYERVATKKSHRFRSDVVTNASS